MQSPFEAIEAFRQRLVALDAEHRYNAPRESPGTRRRVTSFPSGLLIDGREMSADARKGRQDAVPEAEPNPCVCHGGADAYTFTGGILDSSGETGALTKDNPCLWSLEDEGCPPTPASGFRWAGITLSWVGDGTHPYGTNGCGWRVDYLYYEGNVEDGDCSTTGNTTFKTGTDQGSPTGTYDDTSTIA